MNDATPRFTPPFFFYLLIANYRCCSQVHLNLGVKPLVMATGNGLTFHVGILKAFEESQVCLAYYRKFVVMNSKLQKDLESFYCILN